MPSSARWCIGFRTDNSWIDLTIFNGRSQPSHVRGVAPVPGVYFLGLPWLYTWGSGRFSGVARDAEHVAEHIKVRIGLAAPDGQAAVNEAAIGS
jgi:putative flavoprotein involved in K+ transport